MWSLGQASSDGGATVTGPSPVRVKWRWRVAAQLGIMAMGRLAAWVGKSRILTSSTVVRPPRPCAPMPSWLTLVYSSIRSSSMFDCGPRAMSSCISMGSMRDSLARTMAFSAVPPMPMPSIPGGHQPAPMPGRVFSTQSTTESDGLSMAKRDLASEPPPLAATVTSTLPPVTISTTTMAGVLSPVFLAAEGGIAEDGGTEGIVRVEPGLADAGVDHLLHGEHPGRGGLPARLHADFDEGRDDASVLADGAVALGAHPGVDEDLDDGVFGGGGLFEFVGAGEVRDVVDRVEEGDVLQGVGYGLDEVVLRDGGHENSCQLMRLVRNDA